MNIKEKLLIDAEYRILANKLQYHKFDSHCVLHYHIHLQE